MEIPQHFVQNVASYDFNSCYPAVMVLKKYPMTPFKEVSCNSMQEFENYVSHYACLFVAEFENLVSTKWHEHYISESKCLNKGHILDKFIVDNGRVVMANKVQIALNECDWAIISEYYSWDKVTIYDLRISIKQYLPTPLVRAILQLYENKTKLKGIEEKVVEYLVSKGMVNACYGMMATDPVREIFEYNSETDEFSHEKNLDIENILEGFNKNVKRFLFYAWGVWVTSYSRQNLFTGISEFGSDYLYSDTDSIKGINHESHQEYFSNYNSQIIADIKAAAAYHNIPEEAFMPKDIKGKARIIGVWDFEGVYDEFKSIGAKRYLIHQRTINDHYLKLDKSKIGLVVTKSDSPLYGYWELTVAGTNKYLAMKYMLEQSEQRGCTPFDLFDDELIIPPEYSGRLAVRYIDDERKGTVKDYLGKEFSFDELASVNFESTNYELHIGAEYDRYIKGICEQSFL